MFSTEQLISISQWMAILTIVLGSITGIAFVTNRGFRFRMVGVTGFTGVLTVGVFALGLSLYQRPSMQVPGPAGGWPGKLAGSARPPAPSTRGGVPASGR